MKDQENHDLRTYRKQAKYAVSASLSPPPNAPILIEGNLKQIVGTARELGLEGVEFHLRSPQELSPVDWFTEISDFPLQMTAVATGMAYLHDGLCLIDPDLEVRDLAVKRLTDFVEWASLFRAGVIIGSMRGNLPREESEKAKSIGFLKQALDPILNKAEELGVPVYLECINRYEHNYLNTAAECKEFINAMGSRFLKIHLDVFHMNIEESSMTDAIKLAGNDLGYIHLADNTRRACGSGTIDFDRILRALRAVTYRGYLTIECLPWPSGFVAARSSLEFLKQEGRGQ